MMSSQRAVARYRIISKLGEGGMGEVYRAADTKLNRDVAIKVLQQAFAADAARMARFEREAQVLASLNHPNIAAIYGVEQGALVMELVEGANLSGPLPLEKAIEYARQIAAGLDAAHEKGIVHRDLKPANIKVTADGVVKLLDFGLAATSPSPDAGDATATNPLTQEGTILGTVAYMAPEQAAGKSVDKRADIWAFGVVLYEMLTGKRLFEGETSAHTLANVMAKEFDLGPIAPSLRPLLRRCLQRDPRLRLRDIGDARLLCRAPGNRSDLAPGAMLMSAGIRSESRVEVETPRPLFKANLHYPGLSGQFAVSEDGQRFLIAELGSNIEKTADMVVLNWSAGLKP